MGFLLLIGEVRRGSTGVPAALDRATHLLWRKSNLNPGFHQLGAGNRLIKPFMWLFIGTGGAVCLISASRLPLKQLDMRFLVLAAITICLSSRLSVKIPRFASHISVSDTFIFLTLLLYDGETAVLLGAIEALLSSMRFSKKPATIFFNSAVIAF